MKVLSCYQSARTLGVALFLIGAVTAGVSAQEKPAPTQPAGELEGLFGGRAQPLALKMKDLDVAGWRRIKISGSPDKKEDGGLGGLMGAMLGGGGGGLGGMMGSMVGSMLSGTSTAGPDVFYTRGQTIALGGETYLVAYQPQTKDIDFGMLMKMKDSASPPPPKPLTPDSPLVMSLLNLHAIGNLTGIRPFDLQAEIADSEALSKAMAEVAKEQSKEKSRANSLFGDGESDGDFKLKPPKSNSDSTPKKAAIKKHSGK